MCNVEWLKCPICGNKTRNKIREDTVLKNYPLYCPKCKRETLVEVVHLQITILERTDNKILYSLSNDTKKSL